MESGSWDRDVVVLTTFKVETHRGSRVPGNTLRNYVGEPLE